MESLRENAERSPWARALGPDDEPEDPAEVDVPWPGAGDPDAFGGPSGLRFVGEAVADAMSAAEVLRQVPSWTPPSRLPGFRGKGRDEALDAICAWGLGVGAREALACSTERSPEEAVLDLVRFLSACHGPPRPWPASKPPPCGKRPPTPSAACRWSSSGRGAPAATHMSLALPSCQASTRGNDIGKYPGETAMPTVTEERRRPFRQGHCDAMALTLHMLVPGSKLALVAGEYPDEDGDGEDVAHLYAHAAVLLDTNGPVWLDVDGVHEGIDPRRFRFDRAVDRVVLLPATAAEVEHAFSMGGVEAEARTAAWRLWQDDDALASAVARAREITAAASRRAARGLAHPDALPGGGPGWKPLAMLADDAALVAEGVGDDLAERLDAMSDAEIVRHLYVHGACDDMAVALHRMTGWPVVAVSSRSKGPLHRLVRAPDGRLLDAGGWVDEQGLRRRYGVRQVSLSPGGGEETAIGTLVGDAEAGVDQPLADAVSAIRQFPWAPFDQPWFRALSLRPCRRSMPRPTPRPGRRPPGERPRLFCKMTVDKQSEPDLSSNHRGCPRQAGEFSCSPNRPNESASATLEKRDGHRLLGDIRPRGEGRGAFSLSSPVGR